MNQNYRIFYKQKGEPYTATIRAHTPIQALDYFHKDQQLRRLVDPEGYEITRLALVHPVGAYSPLPTVESDFDLPKTPNPDLSIRKDPAPLQTETMGFFDGATGGRLSQ